MVALLLPLPDCFFRRVLLAAAFGGSLEASLSFPVADSDSSCIISCCLALSDWRVFEFRRELGGGAYELPLEFSSDSSSDSSDSSPSSSSSRKGSFLALRAGRFLGLGCGLGGSSMSLSSTSLSPFGFLVLLLPDAFRALPRPWRLVEGVGFATFLPVVLRRVRRVAVVVVASNTFGCSSTFFLLRAGVRFETAPLLAVFLGSAVAASLETLALFCERVFML